MTMLGKSIDEYNHSIYYLSLDFNNYYHHNFNYRSLEIRITLIFEMPLFQYGLFMTQQKD